MRWFFRVRENQATATSGADRRDGFAGRIRKVSTTLERGASRRCPPPLLLGVLGERAWSSDP